MLAVCRACQFFLPDPNRMPCADSLRQHVRGVLYKSPAPQVVQKIWKAFGKAEVDLFASKDNSHCPTYYSKDRDALAHDWPNLLLYAFPHDRPASTGRQAYQGTGSQGAIGWPPCGADSATNSSPLAVSPETGSPLSGERNNMAPLT